MLDCLQLVHCHPGSQLQDIRRVKDAINELAHVYAELKLMGAGLQVHRRGRRPRRGLRRQRHELLVFDELHAQRIRERRRVSNRERLQRARYSAPDDHQRVGPRDRRVQQRADLQRAGLLGARQVQGHRRSSHGLQRHEELPQPVQDLFEAYRSVSASAGWSSAITTRSRRATRSLQMFNLGLLSLEFRGLAERLYWATCAKIRDCCRRLDRRPEELDDLESHPLGHLLLQLLGVPVAAGQLGDRPAVPDHADPPARRAPDAHRRARGHHLRLGRQDRQVRLACVT